MNDAAESQGVLRLIADAVPIHLLHLDLGERILFANRAAAEMWNSTPDAIIGKTIREIVGDEGQRALEAYTRRVERGETVVYEAPFVRRDGSVRYFLNTYAPQWSDDGRVIGFIATGTDITERKQAEEAAHESRIREEKARAALERERDLRDQFVSMVTHDIRTPLTAALVSAELSLRRAEEPDVVRRLAGKIVDHLGRADAMLRDLLDASLLQAGMQLPLARSPCDLHAVAADVIEELSTVHGNRFVLRSGGSIRGDWDCMGLRRLIENLCSNAVKHGSAHTPVTVTLEEGDGEAVRLSVHNGGHPIPAEEIGRLFEPFRRAPAGPGRPPGWGLGLALVKGIVDAHGGSVAVTSDEQHGTTFTVALPAAGPPTG